MSDINTPMGVIVCPQCSLPKLAGVYGYAGPQCQCWHLTPQPTLDVAGTLLQQSEEIRRLRAELAAAAPAPAGVPMPKPVAYGFGNTAITGHTNRLMMVRIDIPGGDQYAGAFWLPLVLADEAHTYGVACRAAGEAAGYARGVDACVAALVALKPESGVNADGSTWLVRISRQDCVEACAALRVEVKP